MSTDADPAVTSKQWEAIARQRLCIIRELEKVIAAAVPILKALAVAPEPTQNDWGKCELCCEVEGDEPHKESCPWRRAREWTKEHTA